eukprot:11173809-Lingulodinium_polyedra.AAC.1
MSTTRGSATAMISSGRYGGVGPMPFRAWRGGSGCSMRSARWANGMRAGAGATVARPGRST